MPAADRSTLLRAGAEDFDVSVAADGLQVRGRGARLDRLLVVVPAGWVGAESEDPDDHVWELPGRATLRVRVRSHPALAVEADLRNLTDDVAQLTSPVLVVCGAEPMVAWLAGAAGEVVVPHPDGAVLLTQRRGVCSAADDPRGVGISLFAEPVLLRPGQALGSGWVQSQLPPGVIPPEPAWLPARRYVELGDAVELEFPDGGIVADNLVVTTEPDSTLTSVTGAAGVHRITVVDARGGADFEVGWHLSLEELVALAVHAPGVAVDVEAWLRSWAASSGDDDDLDRALGEALESPSLWGVLAGLRAAAFTELPVWPDVRESARRLAADAPTSEAIPVLAAHSLRLGVDLVTDELFYPPAGPLPEAWRLLGGPEDASQQLLADLEFGRISSEPPSFGGRQVALAELWLASRPDSAVHVELGHAVDRARRRLLCQLSTAPDPLDVAWLLVGHGLG